MTSYYPFITEQQLLDLISKNKAVVLCSFVAQWSFNSKIIDDYNQRLQPLYPKVKTVRIDISQYSDVFEEYKLSKVPTTLIFFRGQAVGVIGGSPSFQKYLDTIVQNVEQDTLKSSFHEKMDQQKNGNSTNTYTSI